MHLREKKMEMVRPSPESLLPRWVERGDGQVWGWVAVSFKSEIASKI